MNLSRIFAGFGLLTLMITFLDARAQDPEFTQFYANPLYLNPAFAGTKECPTVNLNYRNQWPAISGTFITYSASYDQYVESLKGGVGIIATSDNAANIIKNNSISAIYSTGVDLNPEYSIRAGFQAGIFQKSLNINELTFADMIDPRRGFVWSSNELANMQSLGINKTGINYDFSAGMVIYSDKLFGGFAAHHLTTPAESFAGGDAELPIKWTAHAGYVHGLGDPRKPHTTISPNIMFRKQQDFQQINVGCYVKKQALILGGWYRINDFNNIGDAFILTVGMETDSFKAGYSFDATVSKLGMSTAGSHEISVAMLLNCSPHSKRKKMRRISCPSF